MKGFAWAGVVLLVAWLVLWLGLKIVSGAIHLLLLLAVAMFVWEAISGARSNSGRL